MQKQISSKIVALTFGVLAISFLAAFYVVAWQEPTQSPPQGNVSAPLNVSNVGQIKAGDLVVNALGISVASGNALLINSGGNLCLGTDCRSSWPAAGTSYWTSSGSNIYNNNTGNVGIGTASPEVKLDVFGTIKATGFQMPTGVASGNLLTSDASGLGTWKPAIDYITTTKCGGSFSGGCGLPGIFPGAFCYPGWISVGTRYWSVVTDGGWSGDPADSICCTETLCKNQSSFFCGNGTCEYIRGTIEETCANCSGDCGECPPSGD